VRALPILLLLAATARADLAGEVRRAFRPSEPGQRIVGLRAARGLVGTADSRERNRAAAVVGKRLRKEPAPEVRRAALDLLLALRTERSFDRLVVGVLDPVDEVRAHVRAIVRDHADPMLEKAIVRALREDSSWRLRAAMVDLLLAGARESVRRPLVDALEDAHPAVRARAAEALYRLTGKPLGTDADRWRAHFAEEAKRATETQSGGRTTAENRKVELKEGPVRGVVPTLYTIPIVEKRAIFVVDMSSSMAKTARSSHFTELKRAVFGLPSDVLFNVLCFDQRMFFFTGASRAKELVPATIEAKARCERWVDDLPAGEKTDVSRSVVAGLAMLREALRQDDTVKAELFILTDGRETKKTTSLAAVEAQFRKLPERRCRVHVIALGKHGTPTLRVLAQRSGGNFVEAAGR